MLDVLVSWLVSGVALVVTASLLSGFQIRDGFKGAMIVAAVLGLLNAVFGKLLFNLVGIGTLGLGYLVRPVTRWLVMAVLLVVTDKLSDTLTIRSLGTAAIAAIAVTVLTELCQRVVHMVM